MDLTRHREGLTIRAESDQSHSPAVAPEQILREIARALEAVCFGSIEITIHNSKVVQIKRKEKFASTAAAEAWTAPARPSCYSH